jgi:hypothetical protein
MDVLAPAYRDVLLCMTHLLTHSSSVAGGLSQQSRKQTTTGDDRTQVYYCLWDSYDCGNYACGLP